MSRNAPTYVTGTLTVKYRIPTPRSRSGLLVVELLYQAAEKALLCVADQVLPGTIFRCAVGFTAVCPQARARAGAITLYGRGLPSGYRLWPCVYTFGDSDLFGVFRQTGASTGIPNIPRRNIEVCASIMIVLQAPRVPFRCAATRTTLWVACRLPFLLRTTGDQVTAFLEFSSTLSGAS